MRSVASAHLYLILQRFKSLGYSTVANRLLKDSALHLLNKMLNKYGRRVIPNRYSARGMDFFLENLKQTGFTPNTIFDIGVGYGTPELYQCYKEPKFVLIEALSEFEDTIKEFPRKYGIDMDYYISAMGEVEGEIDITVYPENIQASTINERSMEGTRLKDSYQKKVKLVTLDSYQQYRPPYLVKIDIEGNELNALKGGQTVLRDTEVIILEVNSDLKYSDSSTFFETLKFLDDHEFEFFDVMTVRDFSFPLPYINMAFIKKNGLVKKSFN